MGGSPAGPPWRCSGAQHRQPRHRGGVLCGLCAVARVGLRERSVEAGSPRRRHRRGVRRSEFLPEAVQCAAALRVLRHRGAHCSRASRSRAVMPSLPSPSRQVGLRPARPLPSCCWLRLSCLRSAASSAACTFRVMSSSVPSLAPPRVRLLLFWRRCSKGLTWGLQPKGACSLRKLMPKVGRMHPE